MGMDATEEGQRSDENRDGEGNQDDSHRGEGCERSSRLVRMGGSPEFPVCLSSAGTRARDVPVTGAVGIQPCAQLYSH
jgi:hypothetical protein